MPPCFDWKRFWCPLGSPISLGDRGFLSDPDGEYGQYVNKHLAPLETLSSIQCLVLLGEPGMGKSVAVDAYRRRVVPGLEDHGDLALHVNLNLFRSDTLLVQMIFQNRTMAAWQAGTQTLHLFLDSLDECLVRIDTLANLLPAQLRQYHVDRLKLRIMCRPAAWPRLLQSGLAGIFGEDAVSVYELAPLRRRDVEEAATVSHIDAKDLLADIDRRELAALAIKPVTLQFLLNSFKRHQGFPHSQASLNQEGCLRLAEETSESRRGASLRGILSPAQRLTVARRIAAITMFCGFPTIYTGTDDGSLPNDVLAVQHLVGGTEAVDGSQFEVSETAVREVLDTGLFSSRGIELLGFAHQTYGEFLAATYVHGRGMDQAQVLSLVTHPEDNAGRIVPQLQEAAAWLASLDPMVFDHIVARDPQALLGSDVATMSVESHVALVDALLRLFDAGELIDDRFGERHRYRKLAHPGLAARLTPFIQDRAKNNVVRRVAIDIAEACECVALEDLLARVALDQTDDHSTRVQAAYAVLRIAGTATKLRLLPCIDGTAGDDPNDELKGITLRALWPAHLEGERLFAALTKPKQSTFGGSYSVFLSHELPGSLPVSFLPPRYSGWLRSHRTMSWDPLSGSW